MPVPASSREHCRFLITDLSAKPIALLVILIQSFCRSSGTCFVRAGHSVKPGGAILAQLSCALGTHQPSHCSERNLVLLSLKILSLL